MNDINYIKQAEKAAAADSEYVISGPIGAYMNHLRWLMLVSNDVTLADYILNNVYPKSRTAFNWLSYEWRYRLDPKVNSLIAVQHWPTTIIEDMPNIKKIVFIEALPEHCLKHYLKINPWLNGYDVSQFRDLITDTINHQYQIKKENSHIDILTIEADLLDNPVLNIELYNTVASFFGIDANYEVAAKVHEQWYSLNKNAEEQMKSLPDKVNDCPWGSMIRKPIKVISPVLIKFKRLTNQEDYDKLLELMKEIYK